MRLILSFICCSLLFTYSSFAQLSGEGNKPEENAKVAADTVKAVIEQKQKVPKSYFIPTGVRVGTDLVALGVNIFGNTTQRYEFQADVDFHRLYLTGSYGISEHQISGESFNYSNQGSFYRIGVDMNFLKHDPDFNTFTVGFKYAHANFNETLNTNVSDPIFGDYSESFINPAVQARWFEINTGLRVKVLKNIYTGYTFRIKLSRKVFNAEEFSSYDIPGFGRAEFKNRWSFSYYVMYRISWKEKGVMPRTK